MTVTWAQILRESAARLAHVSETPRLDAELLLARALTISRASLLARLRDPAGDTTHLDTLLERRLACEPLSYIFGEWEFYGLPFFVEAPLLSPRPETEELVVRALDFLEDRPEACQIIDVGCGTGCIAVSVAVHAPAHKVHAVDIRGDALTVTRRNAQRHHCNVTVTQSDLLTAFSDKEPLFDLIISNPPYVAEKEWSTLSPVITRHEDPGALLAGVEGLDIYKRLIPQAAALLRQGGCLLLESGEDQHDALRRLLVKAGFSQVESYQDLAGLDRIMSARKGMKIH
ncbi:MAG: peptide chain release factor N(5)-glutamine methyltransferase [Candidatus Hydrogenedens sp.]|jgi:release factor glutamine methyltransferase|nr:peptide chain release factor N(5)-glutamine methyltransferase [Candidatus Hydrogenedens sp.]